METIYNDSALFGSKSVLGLKLSSNRYLRSAMVRFPLPYYVLNIEYNGMGTINNFFKNKY